MAVLKGRREETSAGLALRRNRCKIAGACVGIAVNVEMWVTRILDYSAIPTTWAKVGGWLLKYRDGEVVLREVDRVFLDGMLLYVLVATLVLGVTVAGLCSKELMFARWSITAMKAFSCISAFGLFGYFVMYGIQEAFVITFLLDIAVQFTTYLVTTYLASMIGCTELEAEAFRREARQIGARLDDAKGLVALDALDRDTKALKQRATIANYSLPEIDLVQEQLITRRATITTAARIRQALERDKSVSVDSLQSLSMVPHDRFALLLLDLCKQFGFFISGDQVMIRGDVDIAALVRDIDGYFARWRDAEATKLGKS
nr:hypothetical protein [Candidatus Sigynarchaeum springense]